jgi:hypothetical protein
MTGISLFTICLKKKCYCSHKLSTHSFGIVPNILVSVNGCTKLFCVSHGLQQELQDSLHFLAKVVTSNETWVYVHDPETKQLLPQHESPQLPHSKITQVQ